MKFTRTTYPDIPGVPGSPSWQLAGRWVYLDADFNTRFPFGTCLCLRVGLSREPGRHGAPGFTVDLNAPLGEPNRLYLWLPGVSITLGLPSVRDFRVTGRDDVVTRADGRRSVVVHGDYFNNWLHPHLDGLDRYKFHRDDDGRWVRNARPERWHWGWLTVARRSRTAGTDGRNG